MVIAAFAGVGKTYFAEHVDDAVDFTVMQYKYRNLPDIGDNEAEQSKADPDHELNYEWPYNYIDAVSNQFHGKKHFIIPSDRVVLRGLQERQIPYILVYPARDAKEEYRHRYQLRGNTDDFMNIFIGRWESWMDSLRSDMYGRCIELPGDKYLLDAKEEIDQIIDEEEDEIICNFDENTMRKADAVLKIWNLSPPEYLRRCLIWTANHQGESLRWLSNIMNGEESLESMVNCIQRTSEPLKARNVNVDDKPSED